MPALVAGIHVFMAVPLAKAWMAGASPAMTACLSLDMSKTRFKVKPLWA